MKFKEKHKLRKPGGNYIVGYTNFFYEYEPDDKEAKKRIIPCLCFYPAKGIGAGKLKKYISESILPGTSGIETNSYSNAPIAEGKYPLLLFNHGFSVGCESNTVQYEELASHGYIVLSIGHLGDGSYELPNGDILMFDMEKMMKDYQDEATVGAELFLKYGVWLNGAGKAASLEEQSDYYKTIIDHQPKLTAQTEIWIKDSLVALDLFLNEAEHEGNMHYSHVDRENIGAFGVSFGGATALSLTHASDLIKAVADLDGFFYSAIWQQPIKKPIMLLHHDGMGGYFLTFPFLNAASDAYLVTVKNSTHANFADYNEIMAENLVSKGVIGGEEVEAAMLGKIDPNQMESLMNMLLLDFFNKYLKGKASQVIDTADLPDEVILLKK